VILRLTNASRIVYAIAQEWDAVRIAKLYSRPSNAVLSEKSSFFLVFLRSRNVEGPSARFPATVTTYDDVSGPGIPRDFFKILGVMPVRKHFDANG
jgi:hypothetical protein